MCGIFGYLNFLVPREREFIIKTLIDGLKRLEYRGYDSAGMAIDGDGNAADPNAVTTAIIKKSGKVAALEQQAAICVSLTAFRYIRSSPSSPSSPLAVTPHILPHRQTETPRERDTHTLSQGLTENSRHQAPPSAQRHT